MFTQRHDSAVIAAATAMTAATRPIVQAFTEITASGKIEAMQNKMAPDGA